MIGAKAADVELGALWKALKNKSQCLDNPFQLFCHGCASINKKDVLRIFSDAFVIRRLIWIIKLVHLLQYILVGLLFEIVSFVASVWINVKKFDSQRIDNFFVKHI